MSTKITIEVSDSMIESCAEIVEWKRTGILTGEALRSMAKKHPLRGMFDQGEMLSFCESEIARELIGKVARFKGLTS